MGCETQRDMKHALAGILILASLVTTAGFSHSAAAQTSHADGIRYDVAGVVGRSDIVLQAPNASPRQAMPLGNGRLGVSVWAAEGFTAQLNRGDTLPDRVSPGQVVLPGLQAMTAAPDYSARLDLYNGIFVQNGGGITATTWVDPHTDTLVIDVVGADPAKVQTAELRLWPPRNPHASATTSMGLLAESWTDNTDPGASGRAFGSLAAISAHCRKASIAVQDARTIRVSVTPEQNGHFQILVASPHFDGNQSAAAVATAALREVSLRRNELWWHAFWHRADLFRITSADGSGEYMENLRALYLFTSAAESGGEYPGSQAGVGDLFSSIRDTHNWDPAAFWHWNLRMQVAANLGAGVPELNAPYFNLYRANLPAIQSWTSTHMSGHLGICVPETMRFNGVGIEYEKWHGPSQPTAKLDCDASSAPYYNARTLSTGAEVALNIWQQYLATHDRVFLQQNYPVMRAAARFLLDYEQPGADGMAHTEPSNAHETQWDTADPTTDIAARMALFPAVLQAASLLHTDPDLVAQLQRASALIPPFPRTQESGARTLLSAATDAGDHDVIADSYRPDAQQHNVENIGLEPVWPYAVIADNSPLYPLAKRTYLHRPYPINQDWSYDPIQAARLGLGEEVGATLNKLTRKYQTFINGFANWGGSSGEFYVEQSGVVADALQEALVQDYDGLIRIAPAVPPGWDIDGRVSIRGRTNVDVQFRSGAVVAVVIHSGEAQQIRLRNPWKDQPVKILALPSGREVPVAVSGAAISFEAAAGAAYAVEEPVAGKAALPSSIVSGTPATAPKVFGPVQIGLTRGK